MTVGDTENSDDLKEQHLELFDCRRQHVEKACTDNSCSQQRQLNTKDVTNNMICRPVGGSFLGNDFHPCKCALGRCTECPGFLPSRGERTEIANSSGDFMSWSRCENQCTCRMHGCLGRKSTCQVCKELPSNQRAKRIPNRSWNR